MSKVLSDTAAIAGKHVEETCNPNYSCFKTSGIGRVVTPMRNPNAGNESVHHAVQCLEAKRPGSGGC